MIRDNSLAFLLLSGGATLIWILSGKSFVYLSLILKQLREREREKERERDDNFYITKLLTSRGKLTSSKYNQKYPKPIFKMSPKVCQNHLHNVTRCITKPSSQCRQKYSKIIFKMLAKVFQNYLQNGKMKYPKSIHKMSGQQIVLSYSGHDSFFQWAHTANNFTFMYS